MPAASFAPHLPWLYKAAEVVEQWLDATCDTQESLGGSPKQKLP